MDTKYRDVFREHLEERLRAGGDPDYIVAVARVYAADDQSLRDYAFQEWLRDQTFVCIRCQAKFSIEASGVEEWDEMLCRRCRKKEKC